MTDLIDTIDTHTIDLMTRRRPDALTVACWICALAAPGAQVDLGGDLGAMAELLIELQRPAARA